MTGLKNKDGLLARDQCEKALCQFAELSIALSGQCCIANENLTFIDLVHPLLCLGNLNIWLSVI